MRAAVVVGVVLNHAIDGLVGAGLLDPSSNPARLNAFLHVVRMPALAFVVGLFIPDGVRRRGVIGYLRHRVSLLLYLYLLWFYLQSVIEIVTNRFKNQARDPNELLTPWLTFAHLWFLPFLAVATVVVAVCRPWRSPGLGVLCLAGATSLAFVTWGWNSRFVGLQGLSLIPFTALGATIGLARVRALLGRTTAFTWFLIGSVSAGLAVLLYRLGAAPSTSGSATTPIPVTAVSLGVALSSLGTIFAAAALVERKGGMTVRLVALVGPRTLAVFLAHVSVVAGTRIVLASCGVRQPYVILVVATVLGVVVPVIFSRWAASRRPWRWLFDLPCRAGAGQVPSTDGVDSGRRTNT